MGGMAPNRGLEKEIKKLSNNCRLQRAGNLLSAIVDLLLEAMRMHESNRYLVHSSEFENQVNISTARQTMQLLQHSMLEKELQLVCRIWDNPDEAMTHRSLPLVQYLIDHKEVKSLIVQQALVSQPNETNHTIASRVETALYDIQTYLNSDELSSVRNFRNKHVAHSLTMTRAEKDGPLPFPSYGDVSKMLETTISITRVLYLSVTGCGFDFENSSRQFKAQASDFWPNWHFHPVRKN